MASIMDARVEEAKLEEIPVVCELLEMFPKELPRLPLD